MPSAEFVSEIEDDKNKNLVLCKYCKSKILLPKSAAYVSQEKNKSEIAEDMAQSSESNTYLIWSCQESEYQMMNVNETKSVCQALADRDFLRDGVKNLPLMTQKKNFLDPESEDLLDFWEVDDMYTFENIGFSLTKDDIKYLSCADCEMGPVGYHDLTTKKSFVALARIEHKDSV